MNKYEAVMNRIAICLVERGVINPETDIDKQYAQSLRYLVEGHSNVLFGPSVVASPVPGFVKHL